MSEPHHRIRPQTDQPLRLLLLCSDSPQHLYLRYLLAQAFPQFHCIVETDEGQLRHLWQRRRYFDWAYKRYHGWRTRRSGASARRKAFFAGLYPSQAAIPPPDLTVDTLNQRRVWEQVKEWAPELTLCTGTRYIGPTLIRHAGLMLNLHTGYLPDYKGNHCIFFAMYNGEWDKIAATLHQLTPELDGGAIVEHCFPKIEPGDGEDLLYSRCIQLALERAVALAQQYAHGEPLRFTPQPQGGNIYRHRDRSPWKEWQFNRKVRSLPPSSSPTRSPSPPTRSSNPPTPSASPPTRSSSPPR